MQTVNENIPVTKVVKVSELRTVDYITDDAMFICVQNGKSLKTTYGALKDILLKQVLKDVQQKISYQAELEQAALSSTDELLKASTNVLSSHLAENTIKTNRTSNAVDALSTNLAKMNDDMQQQFSSLLENYQRMSNRIEQIDTKYSTLPSNVESMLDISSKAIMNSFEQLKNDISSQANSTSIQYKKLFKNISANIEKGKSELNDCKNQIDVSNNTFEDAINKIKDRLNKDKTIVEDKIANVESNIKKNTSDIGSNFDSAKVQLSSMESQIAILKNQIISINDQMSSLVEENAELQKKVKELVAYNEDSYCATVNEGTDL